MLKEQLDQVERTGVDVVLSNPYFALICFCLALALALFSLHLAVKDRSYTKTKCAMGVLAGIALIGVFLPTPFEGADLKAYNQTRSDIVKTVLMDEYGLDTTEDLRPESWGPKTVIRVYSDSGRHQVRPEIDEQGELVLWRLDGTEMAPLAK